MTASGRGHCRASASASGVTPAPMPIPISTKQTWRSHPGGSRSQPVGAISAERMAGPVRKGRGNPTNRPAVAPIVATAANPATAVKDFKSG